MAVWKGKKVVLHTTMGDITIELFEDMPITVGNFAKLVEKGYYDGVIFHRMIDGFMVQGGDPTGTGWADRGMQSPTNLRPPAKTIAGPFRWQIPGRIREAASSLSTS